MEPIAQEDQPPATAQWVGMAAGPLLALAMWLAGAPDGLNDTAWGVACVGAWMACWWISEAMPLPVTSLLPVVLMPQLGLVPFADVIAAYANPIIFLFLGGFLISAAMQKWRLHVRLSLWVIRQVGCGAKTVLAGIMLTTCFLALWMSNTATAVMMMPLALSIATLLMPEGTPQRNRFSAALALGVAYSAAIGGLGSFIGTPTNATLLGHLNTTYDQTLNLTDWMAFGIPTAALLACAAWAVLAWFYLRVPLALADAESALRAEAKQIGRMSHGERMVALVFALCAGLWSAGPLLDELLGTKVEDAAIALFGAVLLFIIPTNIKQRRFVLEWEDAATIPWGILLFFGGSLSLSAALTATGMTAWLSDELRVFEGVPYWLMIAAIVALIIAVSELMSNVATIAAFLPILSALAAGMGIEPLVLLIPATLAASCGFMMPGASAPNALAYGTGCLRARDMVWRGLWVNLAATLIITTIACTLMPWAMGL